MLTFLIIWSIIGLLVAIIIAKEMANVKKNIVHGIVIFLCGPLLWFILGLLALILWGQKKK